MVLLNKETRSTAGWVLGLMAHGCFDKDLRLRSADGVSVGAQASHSGGSPINQRECAGFNWPELSIPAQEPVSISPEAVSRAGDDVSIIATLCPSGIPVSCGRGGKTPRDAS